MPVQAGLVPLMCAAEGSSHAIHQDGIQWTRSVDGKNSAFADHFGCYLFYLWFYFMDDLVVLNALNHFAQ
jgi:hypothetical protein